jgi:hypothetical protein
MHSVRRTLGLLLALAALTAAPALAQPPYSPPTLKAVANSRTSVTLEITAGPTGAPAGFEVQWTTKSDYDLYGWDYSYSYLCSCTGTPTWNFYSSTPTYDLGPDVRQIVEMGDLFDETGLSADYASELDTGVEYVFRASALGDASWSESDYSAEVFASTRSAPSQNCVYTQGYWKNHAAAWPVASLTLGTVNYTQAELLQILNEPAGGNGLLILAHQLIAAKLNIAQGADPTPVAGDIASADALIGGLVCPPIGAGWLDPATVSATAQALDSYNNGQTTVPHCGDTSSQPSTWGRVKSLYR